MKRNIILSILFVLSAMSASAQGWNVNWQAEGDLLGGTGEYLPFWSRTGRNGIVPYSSSALVIGGADVEYKAQNGIYFEAGANLVGSLESQNPINPTRANAIIDRLYVGGGWKMLHLEAGMKPRENELGELSISGGNVLWSNNARNVPGINGWSDWIYFEKGHWFGFKGNIGHYQMIDNRYVAGTMLHNKSLSLKAAAGRKVDLIFGVDHWAQWGGVSPREGAQPSSLMDFLRIACVQAGGEDATASDQLNVLGNHLGREYWRVDWRASKFTMTFQYDMPFEDNGGIKKLQNFPDGVWSLKFSFADRDAFVTDVIGEFINTTWQAGPLHDRPATEEEMKHQNPESPYYGKIVLGGLDNYFMNSTYRSGWTNYGRVIGLPLILTSAPNADGIVTGIVNNRVRAYHIGLKGNAFEGVPYIFKSTYSSNWGHYWVGESNFFYTKPWQLSLALEFEFGKEVTNLPLTLGVGAYGDFGKLYQNSVGLTLRFIYNDSRSF
ncbi:MAG: hypothetical protein IKV75_04755 [Bacteroidales bacterium]|nr:hypothetical protein [Bacteroidales bacterium]